MTGAQSCQPATEAFPAPWKSTNAAKASNFGSVAARVTSMTPDPANPGQMTQVTIAKVFGGLQDDPQTAKELAARIAEAVNAYPEIATLRARVSELEAQLAKSCDDTRFEDSDAGCARAFKAEARVDDLTKALEWQPIETAPKDGTPALFCVWDDATQDTLPVTSGFWSRLSSKWFSEVSGHGIAPTHWMPLLAPPTTVAMPLEDRK